MLLCKCAAAKESHLFVVKKDEADGASQFLRQRLCDLREGQHAAGVVVHRVLVGRSLIEPPEAEKQHEIQRADGERHGTVLSEDLLPENDGADLRTETEGKDGHADQKLIHEIPDDVPRRNEVRERQHRAGIVMGGVDDLCRLRIAHDHVL